MLKEPFFKIENDYYMIKGVQGKDYFRIAVHGKHEEELVKTFVLEKRIYWDKCSCHGMNNNIIFKADCMQNTSLLYCAYEIITGGRR